jgi:hypothetical protein
MDARAGSAADLRGAAKTAGRVCLDDACPSLARDTDRAFDSHAAAGGVDVLEFDEVRLQEPVVPEVGEELEDLGRRVLDRGGRGDLYQPRVSSSSSGASAAADSPLIASPSPRETRARMSASR